MLPHPETDRSERSGRRWVKRATPVVAAVALIGASVALISYAALAAPVEAYDTDDSAIVSHTCRHDDCAAGTTAAFHTCRHDDCAAGTTAAFHTCHHGDGCDGATTAAFHTCRHDDGCTNAGALVFHQCRHSDGCHAIA